MRRNLESLSLRLRSRCLRTATACHVMSVRGISARKVINASYLLDQHVQVLWNRWSQACSNLIVSYCEPSDGLMAKNMAFCRKEFFVLMQFHLFILSCIVLNQFSTLLLQTGSCIPFDLRIRRILLPVTTLTCAMPCESRRATPICEGVAPLRASLQIWSTTCSGVVLSHAGGVREYGTAEEPARCELVRVGARH